ncbi:MAG: hypothetical protein BWY10_02409 [Chloroflexi bacterium ADurb.Bin180]|nr:MAG: hypothetical protein BWY10_02409 [Chloroflexi bacterium ADurb.Bin180]
MNCTVSPAHGERGAQAKLATKQSWLVAVGVGVAPPGLVAVSVGVGVLVRVAAGVGVGVRVTRGRSQNLLPVVVLLPAIGAVYWIQLLFFFVPPTELAHTE